MTRLHHIRWSTPRDVPALLAIDAAAFEVPLTERDYLDIMRCRSRITMLFEDARGCVLGYMVYELFPRRLRLLRLAVHESHRGTGVGSALLAKLAHKCASHRRELVAVVVDERNVSALRFLAGRGYRAVGLERGGCGAWDGVVMEYRPPDEAYEGGPPVNRVSQWEGA